MANIDDAKNQAREYIKLTQTNKVSLAGTVVSNYVSEPRPKMKDGAPVMDANNEPQFYAPRMSCKIAFTGGEVEVPLTSEQYAKVKVGEMYMFTGRQGLVKSFGNESVGVIYDTIEEL